jgi:hypothetical protein
MDLGSRVGRLRFYFPRPGFVRSGFCLFMARVATHKIFYGFAVPAIDIVSIVVDEDVSV